MSPLEVGLIVGTPAWGAAIFVLLYRIGNMMGQIVSRLDELERRADAWDQALANGLKARPQNRERRS